MTFIQGLGHARILPRRSPSHRPRADKGPRMRPSPGLRRSASIAPREAEAVGDLLVGVAFEEEGDAVQRGCSSLGRLGRVGRSGGGSG
jgi:hypothetical protein